LIDFIPFLSLSDIGDSQVRKLKYCIVSESGASVYSASPISEEEFPHMDLVYRAAVSIGRRLQVLLLVPLLSCLLRFRCLIVSSLIQDPLSELCKIPPESVGVGMYQHDVDAKKLRSAAFETTLDCVNAVGVNLNTASYPSSYPSSISLPLYLPPPLLSLFRFFDLFSSYLPLD